jgi:hypothetical protein
MNPSIRQLRRWSHPDRAERAVRRAIKSLELSDRRQRREAKHQLRQTAERPARSRCRRPSCTRGGTSASTTESSCSVKESEIRRAAEPPGPQL